jgi:outer membrane protein TolC
MYNAPPMLRSLLLYIVTFFCLLTLAQAETQTTNQMRTLSLDEAILLAVRENPNVQNSQLSHVLQKFAVEVQNWEFQPHFAFQATRTITSTVANGLQQNVNTSAIQPQVTWLSPVGTQATLTSTNNIGSNYNPGLTLQIVQPLIRGFGKPVVEAALYNAIDSERVSKLNVQGTLRTTITAVINAYLDVVSAEHTVKNDMDSLKRAQVSVQQTKMFIKAGRKAGVELVTVEADVANAQTKLENDKNALQQSRYALLTAIGIDPNTEISFSSLNVSALIKKYHVPDLVTSKQLILENDIQYQTDQITINGTTKRSLLIAKDNTRWQLNLTTNATVGNSSGGGPNAGTASLTNGNNQSQSASLNLVIPIDDMVAKQALASAQIALKEAEIALKQERWQKETNAINGWNTISSAVRALKFAEDAEALQLKTYNISFQKYSYGLIDSLELQSAQQQLNQREQALIDAQVNYLKALVNLDQLIGNTLNTWDIGVRYA